MESYFFSKTEGSWHQLIHYWPSSVMLDTVHCLRYPTSDMLGSFSVIG